MTDIDGADIEEPQYSFMLSQDDLGRWVLDFFEDGVVIDSVGWRNKPPHGVIELAKTHMLSKVRRPELD